MPQDFGFAPIGQDDDFGFEEFGFEPISETKRPEPELRQEPEKSFLSKAWGFLNTPPEFITSGANRLADWITDPNTYGRFKGLGGPGAAPGMAGMLGGAIQGASELLTPINVADVATLGATRIPRMLNRGVSALTGAGGVQDIAEGNYGQGVLELVGGIAGFTPGSKNALKELTTPIETGPKQLPGNIGLTQQVTSMGDIVPRPKADIAMNDPVLGALAPERMQYNPPELGNNRMLTREGKQLTGQVETVGTDADLVRQINRELNLPDPHGARTEDVIERLKENVLNHPLMDPKTAKLQRARAQGLRDGSIFAVERKYGKEAAATYRKAIAEQAKSAPKLSQQDVNLLFKEIALNNTVPDIKKADLQDGLIRLLHGEAPTKDQRRLLGQVFGQDFSNTLRMLGKSTDEVTDAVPKKLDAKTILKEAVNTPRAVMASADWSAPLRQGLPLIHRKEWWKALGPMAKSGWDNNKYLEVMSDIEAKPTYEAAQEAGLQLTDLINAREENFVTKWLENVPGFGRLYKGSNRAYTAFLNKLRSDTFDAMLRDSQALGQSGPEVNKAIADFVNNATGRATLGVSVPGVGKTDILERNAELLNGVFFSPRLQASRIKMINQTLNPYAYYKAPPVVRKEALKSLFSIVGLGGTLGSLAEMSGLGEVNLNPTNSDFGKIRVGNVRMDPYGGFQQYAVFANRLLSGRTTSPVSGKTREFGTGFGDVNRGDITQRFIENKLNPTTSLLINLWRGTDNSGMPTNVQEEVISRSLPLFIQDLYELSQEDPMLLPLGALGGLGFGIQSFGPESGSRLRRP